jgi:hypothetical protein
MEAYGQIFSKKTMADIFPPDRTPLFFDALYGDADAGAYNIILEFVGSGEDQLLFVFKLTRRPGACLACNLTYGLPKVFDRHPIIDLKGIVRKIEKQLNGRARCGKWELGPTREVSAELHEIPLTVSLQS